MFECLKSAFCRGRKDCEGGSPSANPLRALWVGRMLDWKRVDTIVRAVAALRGRVTLTLVGDGPERGRIMKLAERLIPGGVSRVSGDESGAPGRRALPCDSLFSIEFHAAVPPDEVRELMRTHEVFVMASNALEGWGATVSEAMTEGMCVVGTYEAGASAALLPESHLFHAGDWKALAKILEGLVDVKAAGGAAGGAPGRRALPVTPLPREYTPEGAAEKLLGAVEGSERSRE